MKLDIILGIVRHGLTVGGGALTANGLSTQSDADQAVGAAMILIGFAWSVWTKYQAKKKNPGAAAALLLLAGLSGLVVVTGCTSLQPGADPLIVRTEQAQRVGGATFDMILSVDNANRPYWRTNAPAYHNFCEWLRAPITYASPEYGPTNVQRAILLQFQLDDLKTAYAAGRASSNALQNALLTFEKALAQAEAWQSVILAPK